MRDFAGEMGMEYALMAHVSHHPDFVEGVRALLVDKDNRPRWQPADARGGDRGDDRRHVRAAAAGGGLDAAAAGAQPMTDNRVWKLPESAPDPAELAAAWTQGGRERPRARCRRGARPRPALAFDPTAPARAMADFTVQLWSNPMAVLQASQAAASEWMELWGAAARRAAGQEVEPVIAPERGDRRFGDPAWSEDPVFDYLKQAYLLAARQATELVDEARGDRRGHPHPRRNSSPRPI